MMDLVSAISESRAAATNTKIRYAVAAKVMDTTANLQADLLNQLLGKSGIGRNLDTVA